MDKTAHPEASGSRAPVAAVEHRPDAAGPGRP
ncbi:hypothetical protein TUE45_pSRTUE45c_0335 (plasmid) [Streptomyces reticuli]|nr:hypothetical protein TUE45_pSRTUE45c_0335 [Streptomyces reticuli]